jgi:hypothetical protein
MKGIKVYAMLLAGLLLVGCSSKPAVMTDHDTVYNFAALRTFNVSDPRQNTEDAILISPFTFSHLSNVINSELGQRYTDVPADSEPDFVVSYHIVLEERIDLRAYDHLYGFGYYGYGYRYRPYPYFYAPGPAPRVIRQGTLVVDMIDGNTEEPIWRGISSQRLRHNLSPQEQRELLTVVVKEILANFPPVN